MGKEMLYQSRVKIIITLHRHPLEERRQTLILHNCSMPT